jgi:hypothetical protein
MVQMQVPRMPGARLRFRSRRRGDFLGLRGCCCRLYNERRIVLTELQNFSLMGRARVRVQLNVPVLSLVHTTL